MAQYFIITQKILKHVLNFSPASQYLCLSLSFWKKVSRRAASSAKLLGGSVSCSRMLKQDGRLPTDGLKLGSSSWGMVCLSPWHPAISSEGTPVHSAVASAAPITQGWRALNVCVGWVWDGGIQSFTEWLQWSRLAHSRDGLSWGKEGDRLQKQVLSRRDEPLYGKTAQKNPNYDVLTAKILKMCSLTEISKHKQHEMGRSLFKGHVDVCKAPHALACLVPLYCVLYYSLFWRESVIATIPN